MLREALEAFRVVVVTGPRQAGKTTLVRRTVGSQLIRLDDEEVLQAALADPAGFAAAGDPPRAIDEIQRGGDPLVRAIKAVVDRDDARGQYLLNGSADFLTVPTISESLAGRAVFFELWPFSQGEITGSPDGFVDVAFAGPEALLDAVSPDGDRVPYLDLVCRGGFPEVSDMPRAARRVWFRNYVRTVTQRDIAGLVGARRADQLPKLLAILAARTSGELVVSAVHESSGLGSRDTTEDYIAHLRMTYLIHLVPAWSRNLTRKITRHPKVHVADSGLAAHLLGKDAEALSRATDPARGALLETFVVNELVKQIGWCTREVHIHHLRDRDGMEVDIVLESSDGQVVAVEVKAAPTASNADARALRWLRDKVGADFISGAVLHTGQRTYRLDDRIIATPISTLWRAGG